MTLHSHIVLLDCRSSALACRPLPADSVGVVPLRLTDSDDVVYSMRADIGPAGVLQLADLVSLAAPAIIIPDDSFYIGWILVNRESGRYCEVSTFVTATTLTIVSMHGFAVVFEGLIDAYARFVALAKGATKVHPLVSSPVLFRLGGGIELMLVQ